MYLYYDVIDDKKLISVVSDTKLDYLGDNFVEKEEVPENGILYLDDEDNIIVEGVISDGLEEKVKRLEDELENANRKLSKIEVLEKELATYKERQDMIDKDLNVLAGVENE